MVAAAEEAHQAFPSRGTQTARIDALLGRAHQQLIKQNPAYAELARKHQRGLGTHYLIAFALGQEGPMQEACKKNADVARSQQLLKTQCDAFAGDLSEWTWALLRTAEPVWAAEQAKRWRENPMAQSSRASALAWRRPTRRACCWRT